ncbi:sensor histidine kinase [Microbacterium sp. Mcb102]|uniref:sensor histidine kinase n=1 Tax=Microbacterium sp. Mcb102 TaxID=2926012 RepID=UPI0021C959CB|nr:histidine kinase [Microbacterium sp. Mcb102]
MTTSWTSRWERFFDVVAAVTVVVTVFTSISKSTWDTAAEFGAAALLAAATCLVLVRRRAPILSGIGAVAISGLVLLTAGGALPVWVLAEIVLFSVALRAHRRWTLFITCAHALLLYLGALVVFQVPPYDPLALVLPLWTAAVVAFALALRSQHDYVAAVEERMREAAATREADVKRRVSEERLRIARDLHDSVANSLTVINLQASTAQRHLGSPNPRSEEAIDVIREVSRRTVVELAGLLTVLRDDTQLDDHSLPSAANIPHLVELFSATDMLDADLSELPTAGLPAASSAALYRVTQEALTNAQRHGRPPVSLRTGATPRSAWLEVHNRVDLNTPPSGRGFGLVGMRERAELAGGSLMVAQELGAFTVRVEVPRSEEST